MRNSAGTVLYFTLSIRPHSFVSAHQADSMKWKTYIVLLAIALSTLAPPPLPLLSGQDAMAEIGMLDVCHSSVPALASNGDMPCVYLPFAGELPPFPLQETTQIVNEPCKPCFIAFQDERPPKSLL